MSDPRIEASKVTKPIQLLAAWLAGLILINTSFLWAAAHISRPDWASGVLIIAAVFNVPIFLFCLFMLQTRFRPEMQEDVFYSRYLERRYSVETAKTQLVEVTVPRKLPTSFEEGGFRTGRTPIAINDLLPSYAELRLKLEKSGFRIAETFGSNSGEPGKRLGPPKRFIITIVDGDIEPIKALIRICREFGLEGVNAGDREEEEKLDLYVGSYSYEMSYVSISDTMLKKIDSAEFDWPQLSQLLQSPREADAEEP
jgi:hypothetical protein